MAVIKSLGQTLLMAWLYYRNLWIGIVLCPIGVWLYKEQLQALEKKKEAEFLKQFQDFLQMLLAALSAGYSIENSMKEAKKELAILYPMQGRIRKEMKIVIHQLNFQMPVEQTLREFAKRVDAEDLKTFIEVFVLAKRSGTNMLRILQDAISQISEKIEVKREIETILAAKVYELKVMTGIPYGIIFYITLSFPEFLRGLYGGVLGRGVMTICLGIYLLACYMGRRILDIKI